MSTATDRWDRVSDKLAQGKLRLYADNVLVRLTDTQTELAPGSCIIAPQNARKWRSKELALLGVVVAVGPGYYPDVRMKPARGKNRAHWDVSPVKSAAELVPCTVKVGDLAVLESQLAGDVWPLRDGEHRLVREAEILAVIEP
jgi:co-chaperonin GroES (HSP10)